MSLDRAFRRRWRLLLVLAPLGATECARPPRTLPADLLVVTVDTLRGDRWGCLGDPSARTPVIDRVARGGLLAFEGRAPAPLTLPSHVSMMTGLSPAVHGVHDNGIFALAPDRGTTLAEALRKAGWTTSAFVSAFPLFKRFGIDRGFDSYDELLGGGEDVGVGKMRERTAVEVVDRVARWFVRKPPDPARPLFVWVHFFDPHADYQAPAIWQSIRPHAAYDAEVAFVDHELGRLLSLLTDARPGRAQRVVVASDHGEALGEHGEATHGVLLHSATLRVPIVRRDEQWAPALLSRPVPLECVARTAVELAGVEAALDSAAAPAVDRFEGPVQAETMYPAFNFGWRALRAREEGGWKLVAGDHDRLYRTLTDPAETHDVAAEHPEIVASLKKGLVDTWAEARALRPADASRSTSAEEVDALRALGYLGGTPPDPDRLEAAFDEGFDPEQRIALVSRIDAGIALLDAGNAAAAESVLARVAAEDVRNRLALEFLGRARLMQAKWREARETFLRALDIGPNPVSVHMDLARVERELGDEDGEWHALEQALRADARSVAVRQEMSRILMRKGRASEAAALLEDAVRFLPRSAAAHASLAEAYDADGRHSVAVDHWKRVAELDPDGSLGQLAREALARPEASGKEKAP